MSGTNATASHLIPSSWNPQSASQDLLRHDCGTVSASTSSKIADNHYWCTICDELKSYKDGGSWKKHEKEHETIFICRLDNTAESSGLGQDHAPKPFACKRRNMMVAHLNRLHGIIDAHQGRDLANQWRHTVQKQAWSCGFCISVFLTFQDRLRHIDLEHFRKHQSIHEWNSNKVILGLLQQPKMVRAWKTKIASLASWKHPESFVWDKAIAQDLRATLEIGPSDDDHANALAHAVYSASNTNEGCWAQNDTDQAELYSDATAQASLLSSANHHQAPSARTYDYGSYHRPIPSDFPFVGTPTSAFPLGNTVEPWMAGLGDDQSTSKLEYIGTGTNSWRLWANRELRRLRGEWLTTQLIRSMMYVETFDLESEYIEK